MKNHITKIVPLLILSIVLFCSCSGEDRSDEQPLAPVVKTISATASSDSCTMIGEVTASHNSALRECGFVYGSGNTIKETIKADTTMSFKTVVDSLSDGKYYCIAYARNGVNTSYGDTLWFSIAK